MEMKMTDWQPIETAPRDGTTILMGKWHDGDRYWISSGCIEGDKFWCDFPDEFFEPFSHQNPTHWRPLPLSRAWEGECWRAVCSRRLDLPSSGARPPPVQQPTPSTPGFQAFQVDGGARK